MVRIDSRLSHFATLVDVPWSLLWETLEPEQHDSKASRDVMWDVPPYTNSPQEGL